jgi:hypothetical protein
MIYVRNFKTVKWIPTFWRNIVPLSSGLKWRQQVPRTYWYPPNRQHAVTPHACHNCVNLVLELWQSQKQSINEAVSVITVQIKRGSHAHVTQRSFCHDQTTGVRSCGIRCCDSGRVVYLVLQALCRQLQGSGCLWRCRHYIRSKWQEPLNKSSTQHHSPGNLNPHKQRCQNLKYHKTRPSFHVI